MDDARVTEAMLGFFGPVDRFIDIATANEWHKGHHLLDGHERVAQVGLAEQQLNFVGHSALAGALREHRGVLAEKILARRVVLVVAFADLNYGVLGERLNFAAAKADRAR